MHAQNGLLLAIECSNCALSDLDKLMEALFFISCCCLAKKSQGAALRPHRAQDLILIRKVYANSLTIALGA